MTRTLSSRPSPLLPCTSADTRSRSLHGRKTPTHGSTRRPCWTARSTTGSPTPRLPLARPTAATGTATPRRASARRTTASCCRRCGWPPGTGRPSCSSSPGTTSRRAPCWSRPGCGLRTSAGPSAGRRRVAIPVCIVSMATPTQTAQNPSALCMGLGTRSVGPPATSPRALTSTYCSNTSPRSAPQCSWRDGPNGAPEGLEACPDWAQEITRGLSLQYVRARFRNARFR
mmetsp:Transcript_75493/g.182393  ORF Transcript_75493/g.182393 Transcript_75493/m.182393 type:complete len:229 (-) Transcript_75493:10-696(-)